MVLLVFAWLVISSHSGVISRLSSSHSGRQACDGQTQIFNASQGFPVAQMVKNPPAMQETRVRSLGREDALEKGMAIHYSIPAWRSPWTEEPGGLHPGGHKESDTTERLHSLTHSLMIQASNSMIPRLHVQYRSINTEQEASNTILRQASEIVYR